MLLTVMAQMKNFFSSSIKEATLTVYGQVGDKEASYSVSTYFVDYEQNINAGGL